MQKHVQVRRAEGRDLEDVAALSGYLWPEGWGEDDRKDLSALLAGTPRSTMPLVIFVAEVDARVIGFVEVGLRSHADGCDARDPVGFLEGWYVLEPHRGRGVGRALIEAAEAWAQTQGCFEMTSDTWLDHESSQKAHAALGYEVVDRCVNFRKRLRPAEVRMSSDRSSSILALHSAERTATRHVLTILAVADLGRAKRFYADAFDWTLSVDTPVYAEFALPDGMRFGVYERNGFGRNIGQAPAQTPHGAISATELYFYVDAINDAVDRLRRAGARELSALSRRAWGDDAAYFADPEGNVLVLAHPRSS